MESAAVSQSGNGLSNYLASERERDLGSHFWAENESQRHWTITFHQLSPSGMFVEIKTREVIISQRSVIVIARWAGFAFGATIGILSNVRPPEPRERALGTQCPCAPVAKSADSHRGLRVEGAKGKGHYQ